MKESSRESIIVTETPSNLQHSFARAVPECSALCKPDQSSEKLVVEVFLGVFFGGFLPLTV